MDDDNSTKDLYKKHDNSTDNCIYTCNHGLMIVYIIHGLMIVYLLM